MYKILYFNGKCLNAKSCIGTKPREATVDAHTVGTKSKLNSCINVFVRPSTMDVHTINERTDIGPSMAKSAKT